MKTSKVIFSNVTIHLSPEFKGFLLSLSDSPDLGPWKVKRLEAISEPGVLHGHFVRDEVEYHAIFNAGLDRWEVH